MKILLVGLTSLLGEGFTPAIVKSNHEFVGTYFKNNTNLHAFPLDVRNKTQVEGCIKKIQPDVLINMSALTSPEQCESDPENACQTNVCGTKNLATACNIYGVHMIQVSTEYVFDGKNGPYDVADVPRPISIYGKTKLQSEIVTLKTNSLFCVARTAMLFGWSKHKLNLATYIVSNLRDGKKIQIINDQFVSPSYINNVAEMLVEIAEKRINGIYHVAGASINTRYEFGIKLADVFKLERSLIEPISISKMKWNVQRPLHGGLIVNKTSNILYKKPLTLEESLHRMLYEEKTNEIDTLN